MTTQASIRTELDGLETLDFAGEFSRPLVDGERGEFVAYKKVGDMLLFVWGTHVRDPIARAGWAVMTSGEFSAGAGEYALRVEAGRTKATRTCCSRWSRNTDGRSP